MFLPMGGGLDWMIFEDVFQPKPCYDALKHTTEAKAMVICVFAPLNW